MVNEELRAARSNGPGIRYLRHQANFFEPDQLSINHQFPRDGCKTVGGGEHGLNL
jgi:hypothetical protein